ncbi:unnamed protein product, partial [Candidula unifasciata]
QTCRFISLSSIQKRRFSLMVTNVKGEDVALRSVQLARQLSEVPCVLKRTFDYEGSYVESSGGCIGIFRICYNTEDVNFTAREEIAMFSYISEPDKYKLTVKDRPVIIRDMILVEQISEIACVFGDSYFFNGSTLYAKDGCKGVFRICYVAKEDQTVAPTLGVTPTEPVCLNVTLRDTGSDRSVHTLTSNSSYPLQVVSMELIKPLSFVQCTKWVNYYFEGNMVLSKGGCWGEFEVCYLENVTVLSEITTEPEGQTCRFISLSSIQKRLFGLMVTDVRGENVVLRSVQLARQLSKTPCVLKRTFDYEGSYVESSGGCIGIFRICYDIEDVNFTARKYFFVCGRGAEWSRCLVSPRVLEIPRSKIAMFSYISESDKYKLTVKDRTVIIRAMILVEQISEIACVFGDSYFFNGSTLYAKDGCKGIFRICYVAKEDQKVAPTLGVTPTGKRDINPTKCVRTSKLTSSLRLPVKKTFIDSEGNPLIIVSVKVVEQLSQAKCTKSNTFFVEQYTLWVTNGCKAVFQACVKSAPEETTTPATTTGKSICLSIPVVQSGQQCENIKLTSTPKLPVKKTFIDSEGNPLHIVSVKLVEQLSQTKCVEGHTFEVYQYAFRVLGGCKAVFKVCLESAVQETTTTATTTGKIICLTPKLPVKKTFIDSEGNPLHIVSVKLVEQLSQTKCVEGHTFEVYQYAFRVLGGCKAVFKVCLESAVQETTTTATTTEDMKCENIKLMSQPKLPVKKTFIDTEGNPLPIISVKLVEQISQTKCVEGHTFSVYEYALRVTDGCKAVFQVCIDAAVGEMTTQANPTGEECMRLEMDSSKSRKLKQIRIVDRKSRKPVRITSVDVDKQMTDIPCQPGETFEYEDNSVRVTGGCGAMFKVCYEKEMESRPK